MKPRVQQSLDKMWRNTHIMLVFLACVMAANVAIQTTQSGTTTRLISIIVGIVVFVLWLISVIFVFKAIKNNNRITKEEYPDA